MNRFFRLCAMAALVTTCLFAWSSSAMAQVDLVVSSMTGLPSALKGGDWVNVNVCVKNNGSSSASTSTLGIYLSQDVNVSSGQDTRLYEGSIATLPAGQQSCQDVEFKLPKVVPPLGFWIGGIADATGLVNESDESNNTTKFKLANASKHVDFTVSLSNFSGGNGVKPGDSLSLDVCVFNTGTIAANGPAKIGLFFAHTPGISPTFSTKITEYTVTLAAGAQDCRTLRTKYPNNMQPAMRGTIGVIADYDKQFDDIDRSDNTRTIPITVTVYPRPDLVVTSLTGPNQSVAVGSQTTVNVCVKNNGSDAGAFKLGVMYARTNQISEKDLLLKEIDFPTGLKATVSKCQNVQVTVPAKVIPGNNNYFGAFVDYKNQIFESSEFFNNQRAAQFTVQNFTRPDLTVTSLTQVPATTGQASSFQVKACVKNNGQSDALQASVAIYFSDSPITSNRAPKVGEANLASPLKAGATACANVTVKLLPQFPAGEVRLAAIADGDDNVAETNENNNVGTNVKLRILGPDIAVTSFSIDPPVANFAYWGDPFKIKYCVKNISTTADVTKPFKVGIYDSERPSIFTTSNLIHTITYTQADLVKFTKGGAGDCQTLTLNMTRQAATGRRYIGAFADFGFVLKEDGKGPNITDPPIPYYIVSKTKPNLVITSIEPPTKVRIGSQNAVKICYANYGINAPQGARVAINLFYLKDSFDFFNTPFQQIANLTVPASQMQVCRTEMIQLPATARAGDRFLGGRIDATTQVNEANELDNDTQIPISVELFVDDDKDGVPKDADCNDKDRDVYPAYKGRPAAAEVCDGKDNDCNNKTDENYTNLGTACTPGKGECQRTGKYICTPDKIQTVCSVMAGTPTPELCNGKDDDCDGMTDNGAKCPPNTICMAGRCVGMPEPKAEPTEEPTPEPIPEPQQEPADEPAPEPQAEPSPEPQQEPPNAKDASEPTPDVPADEPTPEPATTPEPKKPDTSTPQDNGPPTGCGCHSTNTPPAGMLFLIVLGCLFWRRRSVAQVG